MNAGVRSPESPRVYLKKKVQHRWRPMRTKLLVSCVAHSTEFRSSAGDDTKLIKGPETRSSWANSGFLAVVRTSAMDGRTDSMYLLYDFYLDGIRYDFDEERVKRVDEYGYVVGLLSRRNNSPALKLLRSFTLSLMSRLEA